MFCFFVLFYLNLKKKSIHTPIRRTQQRTHKKNLKLHYQKIMADIPTISITREDTIENDDDDDNNDGCDITQAHTDIEDLDSDDNLRRAKSPVRQLKLRRKNCKRISNAATDIEDYNDSDSDDEKNVDGSQYETEISLNEFLDQGYVDEANATCKTNRRGYNQGVEYSMKRLGIDDNDIGGVTDCENVETSGDEGIVTVATPAKYDNFLVDNEDDNSICIQNSVTKNEKPEIVCDSVVTSDSELDQPSERKNRRKKNVKARNVFMYDLSDIENIMFTDDDDSGVIKNCPSEFDAEEIVLESSDNENNENDSKSYPLPNFDITFSGGNSTFGLRNRKAKSSNMKPSTSKSTLSVTANDEGCTDVENLDSSDDDDDDEEPVAKNRLFIPTAFVKSDQLPMTDVEDFGSDDDESLQENFFRSEMKMPSPVREITFTKENATGARMSKVMPMNGNLFLGIDDSYIDKGMTDTEEMSGKEEDYCDTSKYVIESIPAIDGGVTRNSEFYLQNKKPENELESITDTEDINVARTGVRRRKTKSRNASKKSRNYLEPKDVAMAPLTDTEDLLIDDCQSDQRKINVTPTFVPLMIPSNDDGITDVESLSGDEGDMEIKINEVTDSVSALAQESFFSTVTSRDISNAENLKFQTVEMPGIRKTIPMPDKSYLTCTDTEEMQMVSDSDDQYLEVHSNRVESVTPELHTLLGDSGKSTIYHKNVNRYDMRNERHHIKGHRDYQEAVTDVEYLDDDGNAQNDACKNESKKKCFFYFIFLFLLLSFIISNAKTICARKS